MKEREMDAAVAERVMGYGDRVWFMGVDNPVIGQAYPIAVPKYTHDVAADYAVLEHVRATWDTDKLHAFNGNLWAAWHERSRGRASLLDLMSQYTVGDYARAALAAIGGTDGR